MADDISTAELQSRIAHDRSPVPWEYRELIERMGAEVERLTAERSAIRGLLECGDDESTFDAVQFLRTEWEHYSKEMNHAGYVTIPRLQRERDEARTDLAAQRAIGEAAEMLFMVMEGMLGDVDPVFEEGMTEAIAAYRRARAQGAGDQS